jgi:endonuclease/exonuclease/phosphatase family metal-dependent hydrolase
MIIYWWLLTPRMKPFAGALRVVTYNVHKCRGMDRRVHPGRIVDILQNIDADIVALQEVLSIEGRSRHDDQARFIAEELGYHLAFGQNRWLNGGRYGNVVLTRFPIRVSRNYDITTRRREPRGCLRVDLQLEGTTLHIFNLHLGTGYVERRRQARRLWNEEIFSKKEIEGPRIVLGDFNEWTRGSTSQLLTSLFEGADVRPYLNRSRTYPGFLPFLNLDHIYFDPVLRLEKLLLWRDRTSVIASDHLPLVADFDASLN